MKWVHLFLWVCQVDQCWSPGEQQVGWPIDPPGVGQGIGISLSLEILELISQ